MRDGLIAVDRARSVFQHLDGFVSSHASVCGADAVSVKGLVDGRRAYVVVRCGVCSLMVCEPMPFTVERVAIRSEDAAA